MESRDMRLLRKYMAYVEACEGIDYVRRGYMGYAGDPEFTADEWADLTMLSLQNANEYKVGGTD